MVGDAPDSWVHLPGRFFMYPVMVQSRVLLTLAATWAVAAAAETDFPYAVGVDRSGRALGQSDGDGRVMIESPEYPRGLWLHLLDEAGRPLPGLHVEYQGRRDSLVSIRFADPSGNVQETLVWTRPGGDPLRLRLKAGEPGDLPFGLVPIDWRVDPSAEAILGKEETRLSGWETIGTFLRQRWGGRTGIVALDLSLDVNLAVVLEDPNALGALVAYLQDAHPAGDISPIVQVHLLGGGIDLLEGAVLYVPFDILLFEDQTLQGAVAKALGGTPNSNFSRRRVASLTKLVIAGGDIHSLAGIWQLSGLEILWVVENQIVDVNPLVNLPNLETLFLSGNRITDVGPLVALTTLGELHLASNRIVDVKPLGKMTSLARLNLASNRIVDVKPLGELTNLKYLVLPYNRISDVSPLAGMARLEDLNLSNNRIVDTAPLARLASLRRLLIGANPIADLGPLAELTRLRELWLVYNRIEDWSPIARLTGLERLLLDYTGLADLNVLAQLSNLKSLHLSHNRIADLNPLADLTLMRELNLSDNQIVGIGPLAGLTALEYLHLSNNRIADLSPLGELTELIYLELVENRIADLSPLGELTELVYLKLDGNRITYIDPLASLPSLEGIWLDDNQIEDLSALVANKDFGKGDWVNVRGNPLSDHARERQIPTLKAKGVRVNF